MYFIMEEVTSWAPMTSGWYLSISASMEWIRCENTFVPNRWVKSAHMLTVMTLYSLMPVIIQRKKKTDRINSISRVFPG